MAQCIIFGAGKIARGFVAHLIYNAGLSFAFVEKSESLVDLLGERGQYTVNVLGAPEKNTVVSGYTAYTLDDRAGIAQEMQDAEVIFTAVGGKNLVELAPIIAYALQCAAPRKLNVVTCENWKLPAQLLRDEIARIDPTIQAGFSESVVMRSAIEPNAAQLDIDPLVVNVQNFWHLPVDADSLICPLPSIAGVEPMNNFAGFLERKFYTYNAANGTVSFVGALLGHTHIADAAWDERVQTVLEKVYVETASALSRKHQVDYHEQMAFAGTSRDKLRDRIIVDTIERNARDPLRKLGPDDRLVGSARLVQSFGIQPEGLCTAIAAALHYRQPGDPAAEQLESMIETEGSLAVLEKVCKLQADDPITALVLEKEKELKGKGWIK